MNTAAVAVFQEAGASDTHGKGWWGKFGRQWINIMISYRKHSLPPVSCCHSLVSSEAFSVFVHPRLFFGTMKIEEVAYISGEDAISSYQDRKWCYSCCTQWGKALSFGPPHSITTPTWFMSSWKIWNISLLVESGKLQPVLLLHSSSHPSTHVLVQAVSTANRSLLWKFLSVGGFHITPACLSSPTLESSKRLFYFFLEI